VAPPPGVMPKPVVSARPVAHLAVVGGIWPLTRWPGFVNHVPWARPPDLPFRRVTGRLGPGRADRPTRARGRPRIRMALLVMSALVSACLALCASMAARQYLRLAAGASASGQAGIDLSRRVRPQRPLRLDREHIRPPARPCLVTGKLAKHRPQARAEQDQHGEPSRRSLAGVPSLSKGRDCHQASGAPRPRVPTGPGEKRGRIVCHRPNRQNLSIAPVCPVRLALSKSYQRNRRPTGITAPSVFAPWRPKVREGASRRFRRPSPHTSNTIHPLCHQRRPATNLAPSPRLQPDERSMAAPG